MSLFSKKLQSNVICVSNIFLNESAFYLLAYFCATYIFLRYKFSQLIFSWTIRSWSYSHVKQEAETVSTEKFVTSPISDAYFYVEVRLHHLKYDRDKLSKKTSIFPK